MRNTHTQTIVLTKYGEVFVFDPEIEFPSGTDLIYLLRKHNIAPELVTIIVEAKGADTEYTLNFTDWYKPNDVIEKNQNK